MRFPYLIATVILLINVGTDYYLYRRLLRAGHKKGAQVQAVSAIFLFLLMVAIFIFPKRQGQDEPFLWLMWVIYSYATVYISKWVWCAVDCLRWVPRIWKSPQWKGASYAAWGMALLVFGAMWWAALISRNNIEVTRIDVDIPGLPASFDGLRVVHISDLHTGTYGNDNRFLQKLVDSVNAQQPDVIFFTGDIVNRHTSELEPHIEVLSRLYAPLGVFSVLGNHDYGDYMVWDSEELKKADHEKLIKLQESMGWTVLQNETAVLRSNDTDSLMVVGVENVGDPPFHTYGNIRLAYPTPEDKLPKILLSHNPAHWENEIKENPDCNMALTLSGHTHAMQMELFGWSPAVFRYRTWGGLYESDDAQRKLYVNIGAGTVGMPARIGATPEITLLTLHPAK
ncbi:MAG: metallophosphoesterase [Muribaculaceae bacterium]|nr:metallophosphoesterase [Muribaculaceae bacterium]